MLKRWSRRTVLIIAISGVVDRDSDWEACGDSVSHSSVDDIVHALSNHHDMRATPTVRGRVRRIHDQVKGAVLMTQLISFYESEPVKNGDMVGVQQYPMPHSADFEFPSGAVVARVVYVAHPKEPKTLLPFASYDEFVLRDKFNEAVRIANVLGACSIEVRSYRGEQRSIDGRARIRGIGPSIGARRSRSSETTYQQDGAGGPARDPSPLRWPDEPGFKAACLARLQNGATYIEIVVENQTDVETAAKLAGRLRKVGFELGAGARSNKWHTFRLLAEFPAADGSRAAPRSPDNVEGARALIGRGRRRSP